MYHDQTNAGRTNFRYPYRGNEILPFAEAKLTEQAAAERVAREEMIVLTRDPTVGPMDPRMNEAKRAVQATATLVEELSVHVHQFAREPEREFQLGLGDVVFFGLVDLDIVARVYRAIAPRG